MDFLKKDRRRAFIQNYTIVMTSAVGGRIFTSSDGGETWVNSHTRSGVEFYYMAFGNGTFIIAGTAGIVLRSTDGYNWTETSLGYGTGRLVKYFKHSNTFVILTQQNTIRYSTDNGVSWTTSGSIGSSNKWDIVYSHYTNQYFVVGNSGNIHKSSNLSTWTAMTSSHTNNLKSIAISDNGRNLIAVGDNGRINYIENLVASTTVWNLQSLKNGVGVDVTYNIHSASYCNNRFIVVGEFHSPAQADNASDPFYIPLFSPAILNNYIYGSKTNLSETENLYVAMGDKGQVYHYPITITTPSNFIETSSILGTQKQLYEVRKAGDMYFITSLNGDFLYGTQLTNLQKGNVGMDVTLRAIAATDTVVNWKE